MDFAAIDVETANARMRSICQIGVAVFENGKEVHTESVLVDPQEEFDYVNTSIHGLSELDVTGQPIFSAVTVWLDKIIDGRTTVSHSTFDQTSIAQARSHHGLPVASGSWLDTMKIARRAWPQYATSGYGLGNLCAAFDIEHKHHDALSDARACGQILVRALNESGMSLEEWASRCRKPINPTIKQQTRGGRGEGPLHGETIVFTGALTIPRNIAADMAHNSGAKVAASVTKKTSILVVGDQDLIKLAGHAKSSKHRKAEELIAEGAVIRLLAESDFLAVIEQN